MLLLDQRSREMEKVKLNTTRTIWSDWSKPFICYDISVKRQNIITGILIVVATNVSIILFFSLLVCYLTYCSIYESNVSRFPIFDRYRSIEIHPEQFTESSEGFSPA